MKTYTLTEEQVEHIIDSLDYNAGTAHDLLQGLLDQPAPQALVTAADVESVLIDDIEYTLPCEVAYEMLRLHLELLTAQKDAARYQWLRSQNWNESDLCVVANPRNAVKLGYYCPASHRLDDAIDAAMSPNKNNSH